jgi:hypothetical protein
VVVVTTPNDQRWPHLTSQVTIYGWCTDVERLVNGSASLVNGLVSGHAKDDAGWALSKTTCW